MKKLFYTIVIGGALLLSFSSYNEAGTTNPRKVNSAKTENTCCGQVENSSQPACCGPQSCCK